jgi:hypothetical protein
MCKNIRPQLRLVAKIQLEKKGQGLKFSIKAKIMSDSVSFKKAGPPKKTKKEELCSLLTYCTCSQSSIKSSCKESEKKDTVEDR